MQEATNPKAPVTTLGPLETRLMEVAWGARRPLSVQDVVDRVGGANYKTVMTVLNRLVEKELLKRELDGRAYRYLPAQERDDFLRSAADGIVRGYIEAFGSDAVSHLTDAAAGAASPQDAPPPKPLPAHYRLLHPRTPSRRPLLLAAAAAAGGLLILSRLRKR